MATISLASDIKRVVKQLDSLQRKQVPYATALALNDVAFDARKAEQNAQRRYLDRPVRFTQSGFFVDKANKRKLTATITIPQNRWKYIRHQVEGGASTRQGAPHAIPLDPSVKNKFGGMPRNKTRTLKKRKGHFIAKSGSTNILFKRQGKQVTPLIAFKKTTMQTKKYPVWKAATRVVESKFEHAFDKRMAHALRTAR